MSGQGSVSQAVTGTIALGAVFFCFSRSIGYVTPEITLIYDKQCYLLDQSIHKTFSLVLKTISLPVIYDSSKSQETLCDGNVHVNAVVL